MTSLVGDPDVEETYGAVGYALTRWEYLEHALAVLFTVFIGRPEDQEAMAEFGEEGRVFSQRLSQLQAAAEPFFANICDQSLEGEFNVIARISGSMATVRNQVAHGIVIRIHQIVHTAGLTSDPAYEEDTLHVLRPGDYWRRLQQVEMGLGYGSTQIREFGDQFEAQSNRVWDLIVKLEGARAPTRWVPPPRRTNTRPPTQ
jgi:hypothetical protein